MFGCGRVLVYDGRGGYGTYLHADGDRAWQPWEDAERTFSAWLWIGTHDQPATAIRSWQQQAPAMTAAVLSPEPVHRAILAARQTVPNNEAARTVHARQVAWATRLEMAGRFDEALAALSGSLPAAWKSLSAGDLHLVLQEANGGVQLQSLFDSKSAREHGPQHLPRCFALRCTMRSTASSRRCQRTGDGTRWRWWLPKTLRGTDSLAASGNDRRRWATWSSPRAPSLIRLNMRSAGQSKLPDSSALVDLARGVSAAGARHARRRAGAAVSSRSG